MTNISGTQLRTNMKTMGKVDTSVLMMIITWAIDIIMSSFGDFRCSSRSRWKLVFRLNRILHMLQYMSCAKLCFDGAIIIEIRSRYFFSRFQLWAHRLFEMGQWWQDNITVKYKSRCMAILTHGLHHDTDTYKYLPIHLPRLLLFVNRMPNYS